MQTSHVTRLYGVILALLLSLGLFGCVQEGPTLDQDGYADQGFVEAVAQGLEARWAITDPIEKRGETPTEEEFSEAIQAEKNAVSDYTDVQFKNEELGKYAEQYMSAVSDMETDDYFAQNERWATGYSARTAALYGINEIVPISVSEESRATLDTLLSDGEAAAVAQEIIESAEFVQQEPLYEGETYHTYSAVLENTSTIAFSFFQLDISLVDQDGVVVETQNAFTDNWAPGEKHRFEFVSDASFTEIRVESASWGV